MMAVIIIFAVIGVGIGLVGEVSEQRRLGRMAKSFKTQGTRGKKA